MKYLIIIAFALMFATAIFYNIPSKQWERIEKSYIRDISRLEQENISLGSGIILKQKQIKTDQDTIKSNSGSIDRMKLCLKSKSVDCINADTSAMLKLVPSAHATVGTEEAIDIRRNIIEETPENRRRTIIDPPTEVGSDRIKTLYHGHPESPEIECKDFLLDAKRIVLHYTATSPDLSASQIVSSHLNRFNLDHYAGYHFIIDKDGKIFNTRPEACNAIAEPVANHDAFHIAYIGDDRPNREQINSIVYTIEYLQKRHLLDVNAITAHADIAAKNYKESLQYMFCGNEAKHCTGLDRLQQIIRENDVITRDGKQLLALTYAWRTWGDMDFILTIEKESGFDPESKGDINNPRSGAFSFGYCQYNTIHQSEWYKEYKDMTSYQARLNHCHEKYTYASTLPKGIGSRFHGYLDREKNAHRFNITY